MPTSKIHRIIQAAGIYFLICGIGAVFVPQSWYLICGLEPSQLPNPFLTTTGAMMIALGIGSIQASFREDAGALLTTLLVANITDACVVMYYSATGLLPAINGAVLTAVDCAWILLLLRPYFRRNKVW